MERKACFHKGVMSGMVCGLFRCQARVSCGLEVISAPKLPYNRDVCTVVWWARGSCRDGTRRAEGLSNKVKCYNQHFHIHLFLCSAGSSLQHVVGASVISNHVDSFSCIQFISVHLLCRTGSKASHFNFLSIVWSVQTVHGSTQYLSFLL